MGKTTMEELLRKSIQKPTANNPSLIEPFVIKPEAVTTGLPSHLTVPHYRGNEKGISRFWGENRNLSAPSRSLQGLAPLCSNNRSEHLVSRVAIKNNSLGSSHNVSLDNINSHSNSYAFAAANMPITPRLAKQVSIAKPGVFVQITNTDPHDRIQEEEACAEGMTLRGFLDGKPLYFSFSNYPKVILARKTATIIGVQWVEQPVESCFGQAESVDQDSGYYSEAEHSIGAGNKLIQAAASPKLPPNRTFANKWFAVSKSLLGGFGVFAAVDIPKHTHILLEQPFLVIKQYKFLEKKYEALDKKRKFVFDGLHGYCKNKDSLVHRKWNANHFYLCGSEGLFAIASNFNHACKSRRNVQYKWDIQRKVMTFTTVNAVSKGEEVFISYGGDRAHVFENFGFICHCGGCENEEWETVRDEFWQF